MRAERMRDLPTLRRGRRRALPAALARTSECSLDEAVEYVEDLEARFLIQLPDGGHPSDPVPECGGLGERRFPLICSARFDVPGGLKMENGGISLRRGRRTPLLCLNCTNGIYFPHSDV